MNEILQELHRLRYHSTSYDSFHKCFLAQSIPLDPNEVLKLQEYVFHQIRRDIKSMFLNHIPNPQTLESPFQDLSLSNISIYESNELNPLIKIKSKYQILLDHIATNVSEVILDNILRSML